MIRGSNPRLSRTTLRTCVYVCLVTSAAALADSQTKLQPGDSAWVDDLKIRSRAVEERADLIRRQFKNPQDDALGLKRQNQRESLGALHQDTDLSPKVSDEQKIYRALYDGLGLNESSLKELTAEKRQAIIKLVEMYFASGIDAVNAQSLGVQVDRSHSAVAAQLVQVASGKNGSAEVNAAVIQKLDSVYREISPLRYFELRTEAAITATAPVNTLGQSLAAATSYLNQSADKFLAYALSEDTLKETGGLKKLETAARSDATRLGSTSSPSRFSEVPSPLALPTSVSAKELELSKLASPILQPAAPLPNLFSVGKFVLPSSVSGKIAVAINRAASERTAFRSSDSHTVEVVGATTRTIALAKSDVNAVVGAGMATAIEAIESTRQKAIPLMARLKSFINDLKVKIVAESKPWLANEPVSAETAKLPFTDEVSVADDSLGPVRLPAGDGTLLPDLAAPTSAAGKPECNSIELTFMRAHAAAAPALKGDDLALVRDALAGVSQSGRLSSDAKSQFAAQIMSAKEVSPSLKSYLLDFDTTWGASINESVSLADCNEAKARTFRAQVAQLALAKKITTTNDEIVATTLPVKPIRALKAETAIAKTGKNDREPASVMNVDSKSATKVQAVVSDKPGPDTSKGLVSKFTNFASSLLLTPTSAPVTEKSDGPKGVAHVANVSVRAPSSAEKKTCLPKNEKNETIDYAFNSISCRSQFRLRFLSAISGDEKFKAADYQRCLSYNEGESAKARVDRLQGVLFGDANDCLLEGARVDPDRPELATVRVDGNRCAKLASVKTPEPEDKAKILTLNAFIDRMSAKPASANDSYRAFQVEVRGANAEAAFSKNFAGCTEANEWGSYVMAAEKSLRNAAAMACGSPEATVVWYACEKAKSSQVMETYFAGDEAAKTAAIAEARAAVVGNYGQGSFEDDTRSTLLFEDMFKTPNRIAKSDCSKLVFRYQFFLGQIANSDLKRAWLRTIPNSGADDDGRHARPKN